MGFNEDLVLLHNEIKGETGKKKPKKVFDEIILLDFSILSKYNVSLTLGNIDNCGTIIIKINKIYHSISNNPRNKPRIHKISNAWHKLV